MAKSETLLWRTRVTKDGKIEWEGFPPLSVEKTVRELRPDGAGQAYAMRNTTPDPSRESQLTDEERRLLDPVKNHINQLVDWHSRRAGVIQLEIAEACNIPNLGDKLESGINEFNASLEKCWEDFSADQASQLDTHRKMSQEVENFKANNSLDTQGRHFADYPESNILHLAILFIAILVEGVINASFFPQDLGLIGGFTIALFVSFVNVSVCFVTGWLFLRRINHNKWYIKLLGGAVFVAVLVFTFGLHSSVAHYRELVVHGPGLFDVVNFDPRGLRDIESLLLLAIGWVISVLAFWKGYTFDDPYPGFGRKYRKWKKIDDALLGAEKDYRKRVIDISMNAVVQVRAIPRDLEPKEKQIRNLSVEVETYFQCVNSYYTQANDAAKALLTHFRTAVQRARGDFSMPFSVTLLEGSVSSIDPDSVAESIHGTLTAAVVNIKDAREKCNAHIEDIEKRINSAKDAKISKRVSSAGFVPATINSDMASAL